MNPIRILIVEDQSIVAHDLQHRLQALGYEVVGPAHTATDALELAASRRPGLVLMDIHLPGDMDGIQAAIAFREQYRIPVVFLTAFTEESTLQRAKTAEPYGYVVKPFEDRELRAALEVALHKHAVEARLRASEEIHRTILGTTLDGYFLADAQGRFLEVNEAYASMTGFTRDELLGLSLADLDSEAPSASVVSFLRDVALIGAARAQRRQRRKDGSVVHLDISMKCLPGEEQRIFCFLRDATRRTELEREREIVVQILQLASSSTSLEELAQQATRLIQGWLDCDTVALNLESTAGLRHFESAGRPPAFHTTTGIPCLLPPTGIASDIVSPPRVSLPATNCLCQRLMKGIEVTELPHRTDRGSVWTNEGCPLPTPHPTGAEGRALPGCAVRPAGSTPGWKSIALIPLQVGNTVSGLLQLGDVRTGRWTPAALALCERLADHLAIAVAHHLGQEALRRSESSYRGLFNTIGLAIYILDAEGHFLDVNAGAVGMYGYAREEFLGRTPEFLGAPGRNDLEATRAAIRRAFAGEPQQLEFWGRRSSGEIFPKDVKLYRGTYFGTAVVIAIAADITSSKRLEERLLHSQKMEAIGQLAGGVAHDFNNILASMMLQIGLLQVTLAGDPKTLADVQELGRVAERAANLTRQLLLFSRRSVLQPIDLHLNEVVGEMTRSLLPLLGEQIELVFEGAPGLRLIRGDTGMIQQVILNLCVNARDAMPRGGRLELRTFPRTLDAGTAALNPDARSGQFVCLSVRDTGHGMDPQTRRRIFEPFFTSKQPGKGTGLGLAMVYGIIQQHRGWIEVETTPAEGSTFTLYFPASTAGPTSPSTPAAASPPPGGTETLLLVEDNDSLRQSLAAYLRFLGYTVHEAVDGPSALATWEQLGDSVSLVLTDMVMPAGLSGLELADRLHELRPDLRIIVSSGYSAELEPDTAAAHSVTFLPKPYLPAELALAIRACLSPRPA